MYKTSTSYKKPLFCDLIITENCMLKCKMCNMWQSKDDPDSLEIDVWKRFIDSFERFVGGKAQIQFVGGEPLIKKGILDLIKHTVKKGFSTTMTTNAYLIDEDMAKDIVDSGLSTLVISLDSIKRQTHDFLRGVEGTYDRLMMALELLNKLRNNSLHIHIVTTIMQPNLDDLLLLAEWADNNKAIDGITFQAIMQPFFTALDNGWYKNEEFSFLWPKDLEMVNRVLDRLIDLKKRRYKITNPAAQFNIFKSYFEYPDKFVRASRCNFGYKAVSINTAGNIFLCLSMKPIGNIQEAKEIEELWFSEKARQVRENIRNCKNNCKLMINCFFEEESAV